jgi:hypothetical protein
MTIEKQGVVTDKTPQESEKIASVVDEGVKAFEAKKCCGKCKSGNCRDNETDKDK